MTLDPLLRYSTQIYIQFIRSMKAVGNKVMVFYHFQLDSNRDYNVTTFLGKGDTPTIKEILTLLPIDLSQGLYHFRFKSQLTDGDEKILAWIDINNIMAKVPQINGSIFVKILKLKDPSHNKLFHIDKLKKAEVIKFTHNEHTNSAPKVPPSSSPNPVNTPPVNKPPSVNKQVPPKNQPKVVQPPVQQRPPSTTPSLLQPAKTPPPPIVPVPQVNLVPEKPPLVTTTIAQNLETFNNQFKSQEQNRENERLAQDELQDRIRKWGYTDGKKINNTTTLLATLHQIWPEWQQVSLTDLLKPELVNSAFKKAVIKVHPDKNRHRHFKEKYLSKRVFELLNESRKQT